MVITYGVQDDMEQWVSHTFSKTCSGYDGEQQHRNFYFHERQRQNRRPFPNTQVTDSTREVTKQKISNELQPFLCGTMTSKTKRSNAPIILNNPYYVSQKLKSAGRFTSIYDEPSIVTQDNGIAKVQKCKTLAENHTDTNSSSTADTLPNNIVYKYFSNSSQHIFENKSLYKVANDIMDISESDNQMERECYHLSEQICPHCDGPLKSYGSWCLRCQRKSAVKIDVDSLDNNYQKNISKSASFALICINCERVYALCPHCLSKQDVCRACHRKRNVCMSCRRTLCAFCLDEVACGKNSENTHINESDQQKEEEKDVKLSWRTEKEWENKTKYAFLRIEDKGDNDSSSHNTTLSEMKNRNSATTMQYKTKTAIKLNNAQQIENNAKLHAKQILPLTLLVNNLATDIQRKYDKAPEKIYNSIQFKKRDQTTQTWPQSFARRDVILNEDGKLWTMLLNEMPKMKRDAKSALVQNIACNTSGVPNYNLPNIQSQKMKIFRLPNIITEVGAISRQLENAKLQNTFP